MSASNIIEKSILNSEDILSFTMTPKAKTANPEFAHAWELLEAKSFESIIFAKALLLVKKKYNMSEFDFNLLFEGFDEQNILGDKT